MPPERSTMTKSSLNSRGDAHDIAVVGAGIVGLSVAWHLVRRGFKVTIYEPNVPGSGCSSGNAGALSTGSVAPLAMPGLLASVPGMMFDPANALHIPIRYWLTAMPWLLRFVGEARPDRVRHIAAALAQLYRPAIEKHREILAEIGALDVISTDGQLYLYRDHQQLKASDADWQLRRTHEVPFEVIDRSAIEALEPQIGPAYQVGVFLPTLGMSANPFRQATAITEALTRAGAVIRRETVIGLNANGHTIDGVVTSSGHHRHRAVVVAAGAWSADLLRPIGYSVPLEAQRGYHVDFRNSGIKLRRPIVPADRKVFITPMETGLRVAGTVEIAGLTAPPNEARAKLLYNDLEAALPSASTANPEPFWMGHRPCLPDSMPVIGPSADWAGLHFAFGHGHLGLTASAVTGDIIGRLFAGEPATVDISAFSIERFDRTLFGRTLSRRNNQMANAS